VTLILRVVNWVALKLDMQITLAGRKVGMVDDQFVAVWGKVRARGISRYTFGRAVIAASVFGLVWAALGWMRGQRIDWTVLMAIVICFVFVSLSAPIRWSQHEDRFLRLTAPWIVKRFD